jgi:very-short-patch-repair endonuclease
MNGVGMHEEQIAQAYQSMSKVYRPCASDNMGSPVSEDECLSYAKYWWDEEDTGRFFVGFCDYEDRKALIYMVEAIRLMNGMEQASAILFLRMAIRELDRRGSSNMPFGPFGRRTPYVEPPQAQVQSPIEEQFWAAYQRIRPRNMRGLVRQHRVGPYRVDFAMPRQLFAIELDELRSHASTVAMAADRSRERYLQARGWYIIRFGGLEVFNNPEACVRDAEALYKTWRSHR